MNLKILKIGINIKRTRQKRGDIDSAIYGFIDIVSVALSLGTALIPGYFNSDLIENLSCQMRCLQNGANQNPTMSQIGPRVNSNLITGSIISMKGNTGSSGRKYARVLSPTKKLNPSS